MRPLYILRSWLRRSWVPLFLVLAAAGGVRAQKWDEVVVPLARQPFPALDVRLSYRKYATVGGQQFTFLVRNLSQQKVAVALDLVAYTVCGGEVSKHMELELAAGERAGNGGLMDDTYLGQVQSSDCKGVKFRYYSEDVHMEVEGTNRIRTLGYRNFTLKTISAETPAAAGNAGAAGAAGTAASGGTATGAAGANGSADIPDAPDTNAGAANPQSPKAAAGNASGRPVGSYQPPVDPMARAKAITAQSEKNRAELNSSVSALGDLAMGIYAAGAAKKMAQFKSYMEANSNAFKISSSAYKKTFTPHTRGNAISPDTIVNSALIAAQYQAIHTYNELDLRMAAFSEAHKEPKNNVPASKIKHPTTTDYFPKASNDREHFDSFELPIELPDLYYIPLCHCYTDKQYNRGLDSAFFLLRNKNKCKSIAYNGHQYSIKTSAFPDNFSEENALNMLRRAIAKPKINNYVELLDYYNAFVWIGFLGNKHAKSIDDLLTGIRDIDPLLTNRAIFSNEMDTSGIYSYQNDLFQAAYDMAKYFRALYYFRLYNSNADAKLKADIPQEIVKYHYQEFNH